MNGLVYSDGGSRFRLTVSDFSGGQNADVASVALAENEAQKLANLLVNFPGPARLVGAGGATDQAVVSSPAVALAAYVGGNQAYGEAPFYGQDGTNFYSTSSAGYISQGDLGGETRPRTTIHGAMASDNLVMAGMGNLAGVNPDSPAAVWLGSGGHFTPITAGTATFTAGSTTVTLSSALSAQQALDVIGSYIVNTHDSAATKQNYIVTAVDGPRTGLTLGIKYGGSAAGAGQAYHLGCVQPLYAGGATATHKTAGGAIWAACVASMWQRIVVADTQSPTERHRSRIAWSGNTAVISDDGATPALGLWAWDADGYLDLPQFGKIVQLVPHGAALVVIAQRGIIVLNGTPEFDTIGSLDASLQFPGFFPVGRWSGVSTPYGFFFLDSSRGLCRWAGGSSPPVSVSYGKAQAVCVANTSQPSLGYFRDYILALGDASPFIYHIPTQSFATVTGGGGNLQMGQGGIFNYVYDRLLSCQAGAPSDAGDLVTRGKTAAAGPVAEYKSKMWGDPNVVLRPERAYVTYRCTNLGATPYLTLTVYTGLPGTQNTFVTAATDLPLTVDVETKRVEITKMKADPMVGFDLLQVNGAGNVELYSVVIEGSVEAEGVSS